MNKEYDTLKILPGFKKNIKKITDTHGDPSENYKYFNQRDEDSLTPSYNMFGVVGVSYFMFNKTLDQVKKTLRILTFIGDIKISVKLVTKDKKDIIKKCSYILLKTYDSYKIYSKINGYTIHIDKKAFNIISGMKDMLETDDKKKISKISKNILSKITSVNK